MTRPTAAIHAELMEAEDAYGALIKASVTAEAKLRKARSNFATHHRVYAEASAADEAGRVRIDALRAELEDAQVAERRAVREERVSGRAVQSEMF